MFFCLFKIKNPPKRCAWRALETFVCLEQFSLSHPPSIDQRPDYFVLVSMLTIWRVIVSLKSLFLCYVFIYHHDKKTVQK